MKRIVGIDPTGSTWDRIEACPPSAALPQVAFGDPRLPPRFWDKCIPEPLTGCWLWLGALNNRGYGQFRWKRTALAHVVAYTTLVGEVAAGLELDHLKSRGCCGPLCCNPMHLEAVTHQENCRRGEAGGYLRRRTHCKHGHAFTPENTVTRHDPGRTPCRRCRICMLEQSARRYAA